MASSYPDRAMGLSRAMRPNTNGNEHMQKLYTLALSNVRRTQGVMQSWKVMATKPAAENA